MAELSGAVTFADERQWLSFSGSSGRTRARAPPGPMAELMHELMAELMHQLPDGLTDGLLDGLMHEPMHELVHELKILCMSKPKNPMHELY